MPFCPNCGANVNNRHCRCGTQVSGIAPLADEAVWISESLDTLLAYDMLSSARALCRVDVGYYSCEKQAQLQSDKEQVISVSGLMDANAWAVLQNARASVTGGDAIQQSTNKLLRVCSIDIRISGRWHALTVSDQRLCIRLTEDVSVNEVDAFRFGNKTEVAEIPVVCVEADGPRRWELLSRSYLLDTAEAPPPSGRCSHAIYSATVWVMPPVVVSAHEYFTSLNRPVAVDTLLKSTSASQTPPLLQLSNHHMHDLSRSRWRAHGLHSWLAILEPNRYEVVLDRDTQKAAFDFSLRIGDSQIQFDRLSSRATFVCTEPCLVEYSLHFSSRYLPKGATPLNGGHMVFRPQLHLKSLQESLYCCLGEVQLSQACVGGVAAIDFGTSTTSVRVLAEAVNLYNFGQVVEDLEANLVRPALGVFREDCPSGIVLDRHGIEPRDPPVLRLGKSVMSTLAVEDYARLVQMLKRSFKARIHVIHLADLNNHLRNYSSEELLRAFFWELASDLALNGRLPQTIALSFPANWRDDTVFNRRFREIVETSFRDVASLHSLSDYIPDVQLTLSEPEAFLFYQLIRNPKTFEKSDWIVGVDVGGGTTDVCVAWMLPKTDSLGKKPIGLMLSGAVGVAGVDITIALASALWDHCRRSLESQHVLPSFNEKLWMANEFPYIREMRDIYTLTEKLKLQEVSTLSEIPVLGRVYSFPAITLDDLVQKVQEKLTEMATLVAVQVGALIHSMKQNGAEQGDGSLVLAGNGVRFVAYRKELEKAVKHSLERQGIHLTSVIPPREDAKAGVALGVLFHSMVQQMGWWNHLSLNWKRASWTTVIKTTIGQASLSMLPNRNEWLVQRPRSFSGWSVSVSNRSGSLQSFQLVNWETQLQNSVAQHPGPASLRFRLLDNTAKNVGCLLALEVITATTKIPFASLEFE